MAYQPKSYRKFVATAATATLVASAVTPVFAAETGAAATFTDVPESYKEAVSYLVDNKITRGETPETFGTQNAIKRVDAAVMIAIALELNIDGAPDSGFTDVPARAKAYVDALKAAGLVNGKTTTTFGSEQEITRGEMALILAEAYELTGDKSALPFTDVSDRYDEAVAALRDNGITQGTSPTAFGTTASIKRGDFAKFLFKAETLPVGEVLEVAAVQATSNTTIEVTFNNELTAEEAAELEFAFDPELAVTDVEIKEEVSASAEGDATTTVVVTTEEQVAGTEYKLVAVNGVALETAVEVKPELISTLEDVTATGVKTLQVEFNKAVDTTKAVFEVKKGASTIGVTEATWNEDKTVATLAINSKLTEGTYTVNVKGLGEEALTGSVEVENEAVAEIKFLSENLAFTNATADTATVGYQVLNQYGEDVTGNVALASDISFTTSRGVVQSASNGKLTINGLGAYKTGDKVVVTAIEPDSAITANTTFTLVDEAKVASISLGNLYNKDGKTLSEDTADEDFYILLDAVDQYGDAVTNVSELNDEITVLSSNAGVVAIDNEATAIEELTVDGEKQLAIKLNPTQLTGTVAISAIANATGAAVSKSVTVEEGIKVATVSLGSPTGTITGSSTVKIPVEAVTNKGQEVTKLADFTGVTASASQNNVTLSAPVFTEKDGQFFLEVATNSVVSGVQNLVVIVQSETNQVTSKAYQVQADAKATAIVGLDTDVASSIFDGETLAISEDDFIVEDQYGNRIEDTSKYGVTATSADANKITVTDATTNDGDAIELQATADSAIVTFTLTNNAGTAVSPASTFDKRFTTVENSDFTSYKVESFGTLYTISSADAAGTSAYEKAVKVYGVTSSGVEVLLPTGEYAIVAEDNVRVVGNMVSGIADATVVDNDSTTSVPDTANASYNVVINQTGETLTATGKVSAVAPKAATIEVRENGLEDGEVLSTVVSTNGTFNKADFVSPDSLYIEDQYGVELTNVDSDVRLTFSNVVNSDGDTTIPTITSNGTTSARVTNLETGDTAVVTLTIGGVSTTVNVREN